MATLCGAELRTRAMMEAFAASLQPEDEYLLDFRNVELISRSAADELYNLIHDNRHIEMINLSPFVQRMFDTVVLGRFQPRQLRPNQTPITYCDTLESAEEYMTSMLANATQAG